MNLTWAPWSTSSRKPRSTGPARTRTQNPFFNPLLQLLKMNCMSILFVINVIVTLRVSFFLSSSLLHFGRKSLNLQVMLWMNVCELVRHCIIHFFFKSFTEWSMYTRLVKKLGSRLRDTATLASSCRWRKFTQPRAHLSWTSLYISLCWGKFQKLWLTKRCKIGGMLLCWRVMGFSSIICTRDVNVIEYGPIVICYCQFECGLVLLWRRESKIKSYMPSFRAQVLLGIAERKNVLCLQRLPSSYWEITELSSLHHH